MPYVCEKCGFDFGNNRFSYSAHMRIHADTKRDKPMKHKCDLCDARFDTSHGLNVHRRRMHKASPQSFALVRVEQPQQPEPAAAERKEIPFEDTISYCPYCGENIKIHIDAVVAAVRNKPRVCPDCNQEFDTDQGLRTHRYRAHNRFGALPEVLATDADQIMYCPYCGGNVMIHMRAVQLVGHLLPDRRNK